MPEQNKYSLKAYSFTEIPKLKGLDKILEGTTTVHSVTKLICQVGENSYFFVYHFGSIVFFNIEESRQKEILAKISNFSSHSPETQATEEFRVEVLPNEKITVGFESVSLDNLSLDRLDILALILGQSTALEYFENKVDEMLVRIKEIGLDLKKKGRLDRSSNKIKRFIGNCITTNLDLVANLALLDKPDEIWNDQLLDDLYRETREMFEIRDRYKTLDYKLRMIQENLELIADLLQHRYANWLEWAIIILIAVEIVFFIYELFLK